MRNDDDRISTPHGPSKPVSRSTFDQAAKVERAFAAEQSTLDGVLEQRADDRRPRRHRVRRRRSSRASATARQFVERRARPEDVPCVDHQAGRGMAAATRRFRRPSGRWRWRRTAWSRSRSACRVGGLVGQFAQRFDERLADAPLAGPFSRADLDERRGAERRQPRTAGRARRRCGPARRAGSTNARSVRSRHG